MTAIAGVVGSGAKSQRERLTRRLLYEQRHYATKSPSLATIDAATFGISPWGDKTAAPAVANSNLILVADMRLDNGSELLERIGGRSDHLSDNELLLSAWLKGGEECLSWIAGDFAIAVFDGRTGVLTLARDPTGQMPLHYAEASGQFAFASMPSGLRSFVGNFAVDRIALAAIVSDLRNDDPRSHFEQISRVLPGEVVRLAPNEVRRRIYWTPSTACHDPLENEDLVAEYRHVLDVAVRDRLKDCARPVATHLSSGYDSSAVTATAARLMSAPDEVIAFTSAPGGPAPVPPEMWRIGDESEVAAATAASLGVRHIIVRETPKMSTVLRRESLLFQEPILGVPNFAWLLQIRKQAAAAGANCLLSGDCGNASLNAGGLYVLSEWVRRRRWVTWARQAWLAAARPDTHWRGVLFNSFRPWIPALVSDILRNRYTGAGLADGTLFLRPEWRERAIASAQPSPGYVNSYDDRVHMIRNSNVGMIRKGGLAGERIDVRDPLSDRRLIEFSLRIPPEQLYWDGMLRPLARAALADRVPKSVINLKFRGLQAADWAVRFSQVEASELLEQIATNATVQELFDVARMRRAIDHWPTKDWNKWPVHFQYRVALIGALSAGMFALVHEQGASAAAEVF